MRYMIRYIREDISIYGYIHGFFFTRSDIYMDLSLDISLEISMGISMYIATRTLPWV